MDERLIDVNMMRLAQRLSSSYREDVKLGIRFLQTMGYRYAIKIFLNKFFVKKKDRIDIINEFLWFSRPLIVKEFWSKIRKVIIAIRDAKIDNEDIKTMATELFQMMTAQSVETIQSPGETFSNFYFYNIIREIVFPDQVFVGNRGKFREGIVTFSHNLMDFFSSSESINDEDDRRYDRYLLGFMMLNFLANGDPKYNFKFRHPSVTLFLKRFLEIEDYNYFDAMIEICNRILTIIDTDTDSDDEEFMERLREAGIKEN